MEYTTPEMIQSITDDPQKQFHNLRCTSDIGLINGDLIWLNGASKGELYTMHYDPNHKYAKGNITDKWTLIQTPVDFMTAANSGKKIKLYVEPDKYKFLAANTELVRYQYIREVLSTIGAYVNPNARELLNGKWLIED